ncbi:MAG: cytochrome P460 family protein [Desulfobacterales bacterium]|nr:MAG: cytochrome P460 family protein [Desulfobacterales bacterium]
MIIRQLINRFLPARRSAKQIPLGRLETSTYLNDNPIKHCSKALLILGILTVILGNSMVKDVFLRPPGLRLIKDPSIVIPSNQHYPNLPPSLPTYRDGAGKPAKGWARKTVATRRFSSDQSALIYYRVADLAQSSVTKAATASKVLHIWPIDTIIILESYKGDVNSLTRAKLIAIDAIKKMDDFRGASRHAFAPVNWSYARFSPQGKPSITSQKVKECHECHSIAFHITGDLVFTMFPWTIP